MNGNNLRELLNKYPYAELQQSDNNEYLISYKFDTGAEIAFDPRTVTKCSIFAEKTPKRMQPQLGKIVSYPPIKPTTALSRVSSFLSSLPVVYKVDIPDEQIAIEFLNWIRWA